MTAPRAADRARAHALMMAVLDGEASEAERHELETLVASDAALQAEWARLRRVQEVMATMTLQRPGEEVWEGYWQSVYRRAERGVAWVLISLGSAALLAWGAWRGVARVLGDRALPLWVKGAVLALVVGGALLVVSVAREKLRLKRRDPYDKEVTR
jgi:anti-sigma factor RsiW